MRLGDLSLCESLFFLGHDPFNGKARVRPHALTIGLAGAALADLLFDERITLYGETVVLAGRTPTGEPIADRVLTQIIEEPVQHSVRNWLEHIRSSIFDTVVETLTVRELLTQQEKRGMFRLSLHYQPTDLRVASSARAALRTVMMGQRDFDLPTAVLGLLAWTIGVDDMCEPDLKRRQVARWVEDMRATLTEPISGLVAGVEKAIATRAYGGSRR